MREELIQLLEIIEAHYASRPFAVSADVSKYERLIQTARELAEEREKVSALFSDCWAKARAFEAQFVHAAQSDRLGITRAEATAIWLVLYGMTEERP